MSMAVSITALTTRRQRREYLHLPYVMHKNHNLWIPPLMMYEKHFINPRKNPHMEYSDAVCFLAYRDGKPAGRIMGIINKKLNEIWKDRQARFCCFESTNDPETAHGLLSSVENWARSRRMERIVGPLGFSNQDPQGFIIEGFDQRPSIGTIYNFEYIPDLIEQNGYTKEVDYLTYKVSFLETIPPLYDKISERVQHRTAIKILEFETKRQLKPYLTRVLRFMNETYTGIYGFIPLTETIIKKVARNYHEIVDPHLIKIILNDQDEIVSFILGIQDITEGFQKAKGRLLPVGYFVIKGTQKKSKRLDLLLGAIREDFRGKGLDTVMAISMIKSAQRMGINFADSHHELESNTRVQAEMKRLGGFVYKRHRVYQKEL
jgi:hypothetical protein